MCFQISAAAEDRRDTNQLNNKMTIATLQTTYPFIDWLIYFNNILPAVSQVQVDDDVVVRDLNFFLQLGDLLDSTSKKTLANYVLWRMAEASVEFLPMVFKQRWQQFNEQTSGATSEAPRWMECVTVVSSFYSHALGALYVRKHFNAADKAKTSEMIDEIKTHFQLIMNAADWMDATTKASAMRKLQKISYEIGSANELMNNAKLSEFYAKIPVEIDESKYFESFQALTVAYTTEGFGSLRKPIDKNDWTNFVSPITFNAFYSLIDNSVKFPAAFLQKEFFNSERPEYLNYGKIGFFIGHELTHGFDDQGSQFDENGVLGDWWASETKNAFQLKAQCIVDQYGRYVDPATGWTMNGINTQGENIADNGRRDILICLNLAFNRETYQEIFLFPRHFTSG